MKHILFLTESARESVLIDERWLVQQHRQGLLEAGEEIFIPELNRSFPASELARLLQHGREMNLGGGGGAAPPPALSWRPAWVRSGASRAAARSKAASAAATAAAAASRPAPAVGHVVRSIASVPLSDYYRSADALIDGYVNEYRAIHRDLWRGVLLLPALGYGAIVLWRAWNRRAQLLRRLPQAGFTVDVLRTAMIYERFLQEQRRRRLRTAAAASGGAAGPAMSRARRTGSSVPGRRGPSSMPPARDAGSGGMVSTLSSPGLSEADADAGRRTRGRRIQPPRSAG